MKGHQFHPYVDNIISPNCFEVVVFPLFSQLDIMDRGTDARNFLLGKVIPLRLGYVGIVNRNQEVIHPFFLFTFSFTENGLKYP